MINADSVCSAFFSSRRSSSSTSMQMKTMEKVKTIQSTKMNIDIRSFRGQCSFDRSRSRMFLSRFNCSIDKWRKEISRRSSIGRSNLNCGRKGNSFNRNALDDGSSTLSNRSLSLLVSSLLMLICFIY